jgi:hypothetical protein
LLVPGDHVRPSERPAVHRTFGCKLEVEQVSVL